LVHFHDQHAPDTDALHGLQVSRDPLARDVAVQPEPIHPGPRRVRRPDEALRQVVRSPHCSRQNAKPQNGSQELLFHDLLPLLLISRKYIASPILVSNIFGTCPVSCHEALFSSFSVTVLRLSHSKGIGVSFFRDAANSRSGHGTPPKSPYDLLQNMICRKIRKSGPRPPACLAGNCRPKS